MIDERCDELTRRLESATSRRGLLTGALAVAVSVTVSRFHTIRRVALSNRATLSASGVREAQYCIEQDQQWNAIFCVYAEAPHGLLDAFAAKTCWPSHFARTPDA